jgi:hypothetical protein
MKEMMEEKRHCENSRGNAGREGNDGCWHRENNFCN